MTRLAPVRAMAGRSTVGMRGYRYGQNQRANGQGAARTHGAGMMDCKAALEETGGDMEQAVDLLRKKGLAKAAKKAGRIAAEGLIGLAVGGTKVVVEVNSETDFVARNDLFQGLVKMIANVALSVGADVEKIKDAKVGDITMAEAIADTIAKIGENMTLRRASSLSVGTGVIGGYTPQLGGRRARQDRGAGGPGVGRKGRRPQALRPHARDARRRLQSAGHRSLRPRSRGRPARRGGACGQIQGAGNLRMSSTRSSDQGSRPSTRRCACSISLLFTSRTRACRRRSRKPRAGSAARSRSRALCATRWVRASIDPIVILGARVAALVKSN